MADASVQRNDGTERVTIAAVGDVLVERRQPASAFAHVHALLADADIRFGNCEAVYSETADRIVGGAGRLLSSPACFEAVRDVGFDVMTVANNHTFDGGYTGFSDTLALLHGAGVQTVGGGADLVQARRPAIVTSRGVTIGFLGYTCVYPPGVAATATQPGLATLSVHTIYQGELGQPGTRPIVRTFVDPADLDSVQADIARIRPDVDVLVVSPHWGIHMVPAELAQYELQLGRAAIDAGADVVLGHHQHILKGIEVYRGRPILFGINHFVIDLPPMERRPPEPNSFRGFLGEYEAYSRGGLPFVFHPESRLTCVVLLRVDRTGIAETALVPCRIGTDGSPAPIDAGTPEFEHFHAYLVDITRRAGLRSELRVRGGEILVRGETAAAPESIPTSGVVAG
jgi:poly-gamma-glutamate capsule biosynthesis protein CapA/YwtB (metallophosphatase superfamily)